ncbi:MAG: NAD(P)-dependent oxidoreductase [Nitrososphaerales archaeon]
MVAKRVIGFIGLGEMGMPMARNLISAGFSLVCYDLKKETLEKMKEFGAGIATDLIELASSSQVIITMLPSSSAANDVVLGDHGILKTLRPGHIVIEMSTLDIGTTLKLAEAITARGASFLDSPVGGTPDMVERRDAEIIASGNRDTVDQCMDIFEALAKNIVYVGKSGNGKAMKLCSSMLIAINKLAVAETITLALKLGIEPDTIVKVIKGSNGNSVAFERYAKATMFDDEKILKKHSWQLKDLGLVIDTAKQRSIPLFLGNLAQEVTKAAKEEPYGAEDFESIKKYYRTKMNLS